MELKDSIKQFIQTELVHDKQYSNLSYSDQLLETGIIDSLGIMKVIAFLEDNMSVEISDEDLNPENFASIDAITSMVQSKSS